MKKLNDTQRLNEAAQVMVFQFYLDVPEELVVHDFVQCFKLSTSDSSKYLYEAIIQAVRYGKLRFQQVFV